MTLRSNEGMSTIRLTIIQEETSLLFLGPFFLRSLTVSPLRSLVRVTDGSVSHHSW